MPRTKVRNEVTIKSEPQDVEDVGEFKLDVITAQGDAMKTAIKQVMFKKREEAKSFFEHLRAKFKDVSETPLKELVFQPLEQAPVHPTPLPRTMTNGNRPPRRTSDESFNTQTVLQSKKPKLHGGDLTLLPLITPKVQPNASSIVFRRPKKGEFIVSANGSPILTNAANSATTTLNIPMSNGNMMSILPVSEHHPAPLASDIDPETKLKLKTLCGHLKTFLDKLD